MGRHPKLRPGKLWTSDEIRDGLVRRGYCVRIYYLSNGFVVFASKPDHKATIHVFDGKIFLPSLGERNVSNHD